MPSVGVKEFRTGDLVCLIVSSRQHSKDVFTHFPLPQIDTQLQAQSERFRHHAVNRFQILQILQALPRLLVAPILAQEVTFTDDRLEVGIWIVWLCAPSLLILLRLDAMLVRPRCGIDRRESCR